MSEKIRRQVRRRRIKIALIVLTVVLGVVGLVFGYLYLRETTVPFIGRHECETKSFVAEYNKAYSATGSKDAASKIAKRAAEQKESGQNLTCVYMQFRYDATYGTLADAQKKLAIIRSLEGQGQKLSNYVNDNIDRGLLYKQIEALKDTQTPAEGNPQYVDG